MVRGADPIFDPANDATDAETSAARRPDGPLLWLHVGGRGEAPGIPDLIDRLRVVRDDITVLVTADRETSRDTLASRLGAGTLVQTAPHGTAAAAFLDQWRPDACVWADSVLDAALIPAADRAGIALFLIDARVPARTGWGWLPGLRRSLLRRFAFVIAGDQADADGLRALGVATERVAAMGVLQEGAPPLPCSQAERDTIAEALAARPVWLAAGVTAEEVEIVSAAHRQAIRHAHRLLLVLLPDDLATGPGLAQKMEAAGWLTALRSRDDEPGPEIEVFIADLPEELGLWYRLSPISLMGGSLAGAPGRDVRSPFEAVALGSAVLFGPHMGHWRDSYQRLRRAGAARAVSDRASLARAVEFLLAPDKVAAMAAAAWEVTTTGAAATDRIVDLVLDALDDRGV